MTQIGSDPHDVSLSVLAAVMEGMEAIEWAALHHEAVWSSASRGDRSVFMLAGWKQIVISAVVSVLNCRAEFGNKQTDTFSRTAQITVLECYCLRYDRSSVQNLA